MCDLEESHFEPDYEEDMPLHHIQGSTLRKKGKKCPVCKAKFTHVRRHVIQEHIPWYIYPKTSCWICELGFGQERFLKLHIEKEHFDNSSSCRFQINIHGQLWMDKITALINKFKHIDLVSFINHEERFTACQGAVWQEEDMAHITFYLKNTMQLHSVPSVPYPAQNSSSLLHWKVLCILLDIPDIHINVQQSNKTILIMGSSIIYWAHQRAVAVNSTDLDLENYSIKWHGIRGMKWHSFMETFNSLTNDATPDIVIIHLGSNDISFNNPHPLINKMKTDICLAMEKFPNTVFIFSELLSRRVWGRIEGWEGERKKLEINKEIGILMRKRGGKVITHHNIQWRDKSLFRGDGVHLTDKGNDIFIDDLSNFLKMICST